MPILSIGIDGCRSGWICSYTKDQIEYRFEIFPTIQDLWDILSNALKSINLILIDIPIGLRDNGSEPRLCDKAARRYLTRSRSSSIFPTPCRASLSAKSYVDANQIHRNMTGKGLSKQTWNITAKIKEVDSLLRRDPKASKVFIESHPELCFAALSNRVPMKHYKKTKEGVNERLSIIESYSTNSKEILNNVSHQLSNENVSLDDILDAWILAISGSKGRANLRFLPEIFEYDSEDLPMRMAIPYFI